MSDLDAAIRTARAPHELVALFDDRDAIRRGVIGGSVYAMHSPTVGLHKVGFSAEVEKRMRASRKSNALGISIPDLWPVLVLDFWSERRAYQYEARILTILDEHYLRRARRSRDWFPLCPADLEWIVWDATQFPTFARAWCPMPGSMW